MADKLFTYMFILIGLEFLLIFAGFDTTAGTVLNTIGLLGNSSTSSGLNTNNLPSLADTSFFEYFTTALALVAAAGIIASFIFRDAGTTALTATIATVLLAFAIDFINVGYFMIVNYPNNPLSFVTIAIMVALWIGMLLSVIEWWGGND